MENLILKKKIDVNKIPIIKDGVDFVFEQNPELSKIGTKEQYSQYIDSIFPETKINKIVFQERVYDLDQRKNDKLIKLQTDIDSRLEKIQNDFGLTREDITLKYSEKDLKESGLSSFWRNRGDISYSDFYEKTEFGVCSNVYCLMKEQKKLEEMAVEFPKTNMSFFAESVKAVEMFSESLNKTYNKIHSTVVNIKNFKKYDTFWEALGGGHKKHYLVATSFMDALESDDLIEFRDGEEDEDWFFKKRRSLVTALEKESYDGIVIGKDKWLRDDEDFPEEEQYVVFSPEQSHLLGTKEDVEKFKEFVALENN